MSAGKRARPGREPGKNEPKGSDLDMRLPPSQLLPVTKLITTEPARIELEKLSEITGLLWLPTGMDEGDKNARIIKAIDLFESIKPADGIEAMLAVQMVGTHHAALECLRRAMIPEQTPEGRDASLRNAQRLLSLYTQQLAALDKHRGKGQKITVERVQVASGGQAIVGDVHALAERPPAEPPPAALGAPREDTVPLHSMKSASRTRVRR
jgi:hypothetical protein